MQTAWSRISEAEHQKGTRQVLPVAATPCGSGATFSTPKIEASFQQQLNLLTQRPALKFRHLRQS